MCYDGAKEQENDSTHIKRGQIDIYLNNFDKEMPAEIITFRIKDFQEISVFMQKAKCQNAELAIVLKKQNTLRIKRKLRRKN